MMIPSRQGESSSSSSHSTTTTTASIWTILATSVISASSAALVTSYLSHYNDNTDNPTLDKANSDNGAKETAIQDARPVERIRSTTVMNEVVTRLSTGFFISKDLPLWLGAGYLIFHPKRPPPTSTMQSPERISDKLLDFLVVGLLLTYKAGGGDSPSSSLDNSFTNNNNNDSESRRTIHKDETDQMKLPIHDATSDLPPLPHETATTTTSPLIITPTMSNPTGTTTMEKISPTTTMTTTASTTMSEPTRYMELMVYNVSHSDMVLSLDAPTTTTSKTTKEDDVGAGAGASTTTFLDQFCLCRPRFSTFCYFSKKVSQVLPTLTQDNLVRFPRYERSDDCNRYPIKPQPMAQQDQLPIGFSLPVSDDDDNSNDNDHSSLQVTGTELNDLRVRGRDSSRIASLFTNQNNDSSIKSTSTTTSLNAVFFPLIGTLMPQWQAMIQQKYNGGGTNTTNPTTQNQQQQPKQVLFLVSGVGSPRNWTHSMTGNSTQVCAQLMQHYLQTLYPHLIVVRIHSETNIFRYDENISFVQNELMPCVQAYRDAHAKGLPYPDEVMRTTTPSKNGLAMMNAGRTMDNLPFQDDWKKSFHVTLSFGDGSPARNHAIQAALRAYRPTYYHCWQLKTFWHESKIVDSDIEIHCFEEMETVPALATKQLQDKPLVMQVVDEIKTFSIEMTRVLSGDNQDIQKFWLRKTHKPVLAVLAVQMPNGRIKLYRGTNMEVSMPTGSLCAERNVIGTALADNPNLKRQDLKAIAVLSVPQPKQLKGRLARSGSVASYSSLPSLPPDLDQHNGDSSSPKLVPSYSTETLGVSSGGGESSSSTSILLQELNERPRALSNVSLSMTPPLHPNTNVGSPPAVPPAISLGEAAAPAPPPPQSPARRIPVYHGGLVEHTTTFTNNNNGNHNQKRTNKKTSKSRKRHLFVHSGDDMNPLRPCGSCNEWLKKIAESNPYFQILTFTDADCNGVYCGFCEE